jgi:hypothetical protein
MWVVLIVGCWLLELVVRSKLTRRSWFFYANLPFCFYLFIFRSAWLVMKCDPRFSLSRLLKLLSPSMHWPRNVRAPIFITRGQEML